MQLIDELTAEHALIEEVLGSLRTFVEAVEGDPEDGAGFLRFFRRYAGDFHHAREEDILFAALAEKAELPGDRGPIAAMVAQHAHMAGILDQMAPLLEAAVLDPAARAHRQALAVSFSHALWHHIDAENSVLLPESGLRLRRSHVLELPTRPPSTEEQAARADGELLRAKYPPLQDREILRGDGCVHCPVYGETCRGLEREWWNEWEWDEYQDHMPND